MDARGETGQRVRGSEDPAILREQAYATSRQLDVRRQTHQRYTVDPADFSQWTLEQIPLRGEERVLDVGCGPGDLLREMACHDAAWGLLCGFDFSTGMAIQAAAATRGLRVRIFIGDAQAIPCADACFDVVMARHMLYHVPDMERAVAEAARVLRSTGIFAVTTNGAHSMHEYQVLRDRAAARFPSMTNPEMSTERFCLENGPEFLRPCFDAVTSKTLTGTLRFPAAQPLVDYFASSRSLTMHPGHSESEWQAVLDFVRGEAQAIIDKQGSFDVTKVTGAIVGHKRS
jgi:SAM-dependent methyltransferase